MQLKPVSNHTIDIEIVEYSKFTDTIYTSLLFRLYFALELQYN